MENREQISQEQSQRGRKSATLLLLLILLVTITVGFAVLSTSLNIKGSSAIAGGNDWCVGPQCNEQCTDAENPTCGIITCPEEEKCIISDCNTHPDHCTCDQSTGMCTPRPVDCTQEPDKSDSTKCKCNASTGVCIENPEIWMVGDTIYFHHTLEKPGDVFTFNTKYTNGGSIDAKVQSFTANGTNFENTTARKFLTYAVTYSDDTAITANDELAAGAAATYKVTVAYKSDIDALPTTEELAEINQSNATGYAGAYSSFQVTYQQK